MVPIITCNPWKPVATKNVVPYTESAIQNGASTYSIACKAVNIAPSMTVKVRPWMASLLSPDTILWWAHVTVAPELNNTAVFNKGTEKGFRGSIPTGGHATPISTEGDKLLWKNAQKNEKKNRTSEIINNRNPIFKPKTATLVWWPWKVASLTTSFNQENIQEIIKITPKDNKNSWL